MKAWEDLGYDVFFYYIGEEDNKFQVVKRNIKNYRYSYMVLKPINGIRDVTLAQCSRLFAAYHFKDEILITSDVDMIVKKDIFLSAIGIHIYGHDLTNFEHVPMCYIQMETDRWIEVMGIDRSKTLEENIEFIVKEEPLLYSGEQYGGWWCVDQEIITKKIKAQPFVYGHDRGIVNGLPTGRLDRSGWKMPDEIIDIHLPKDPLNNLDKIIPVTYDWVKDYANEYMEA